ncbi:unnamed protein product [Soboliphyme baturini]|uniref:CNH domain-containing protein n=1 Tax=Soboliphyme baturini TaxID=241478 RepID=A0A183ISM6_9BILA|nr:unnamed protein product [Soboliphyme baturini]
MTDGKLFDDVVLPEETCGLFNAVLTDGNRVTAIQFDSCYELLWMGNSAGRVTSFYGSAMGRYTSFRMFPADEVRSLLSLDDNILALSPTAVKCNTKCGLCVSSLCSPEFHDLQCVLMNRRSPDNAFLGGLQSFVNVLNLPRMELVEKVPIPEADCVLMKGNESVVYSATSKGQVSQSVH